MKSENDILDPLGFFCFVLFCFCFCFFLLSKPFESNTHAQSHRVENPARMRALRGEWMESNVDNSLFNTYYQDISK